MDNLEYTKMAFLAVCRGFAELARRSVIEAECLINGDFQSYLAAVKCSGEHFTALGDALDVLGRSLDAMGGLPIYAPAPPPPKQVKPWPYVWPDGHGRN